MFLLLGILCSDDDCMMCFNEKYLNFNSFQIYVGFIYFGNTVSN